MATIFQRRGRRSPWQVQWFRPDGSRATRSFVNESEAIAFSKTLPATSFTLAERLMIRRHITASGCWEWQGHRTPEGYGVIAVDGKTRSVHRVSHETFVGAIPAGLVIDHLCRNRACFNPEHLEPVTYRENTHRSPDCPTALNARKTTCLNGHPFDEENTYTRDGQRERLCRACRHEATRRYRAHRAAAAIEQSKADAEQAATVAVGS